MSDLNLWRRTFRPDTHSDKVRLESAWVELEIAVENGYAAEQLGNEDLDYLIADRVAIRHHRLPGAEPHHHFHTVVTERDGLIVLDSHIEDEPRSAPGRDQ
jgi:hypothetical protein